MTETEIYCFQGPKSSFITPEKKAKLKCNPVKVHFAEEVEVNGQSQVSPHVSPHCKYSFRKGWVCVGDTEETTPVICSNRALIKLV